MSDAAAPRDFALEIACEHWALLADSVRSATLVTALLGALYAAWFSRFAGIPQTWLWWLGLVAVLALRHVLLRSWRPGVMPSRTSIQTFYGITCAYGLVWGLAPLVVAARADDAMMLTALLVTTAMALTAFSAFASRPPLALAATLPMALASGVALVLAGNRSHYPIMLALLLLYAHQVLTLLQARRVLDQQITLRIENGLLAQQLSDSAEKTAAELDRRMETERLLRASRDRAERLSATDGLTELANRRYFDKRLKSEVSRAFRDRTPLSLVLCDLDYFKQFNDRYGHQRGDECLKAFARTLESFCRRGGDLAARIGGEEFALLLPNTEHGAALTLSERVRAAFDDLGITHEGSQVSDHATASFGVATAVPASLDVGAELFGAADQALYRAKGAGRNRVVGAPPPGGPDDGLRQRA